MGVAAGGATHRAHRIIAALSGPRGSTAAIGPSTGHGTVRLWDISTNHHRVVKKIAGRAYGIDLDADGTKIGIANSSGNAYLLDLSTNRQTILKGHRSEVNDIKFTPDGKYAGTVGDDGSVRLWEVATGKPVWRAPFMHLSPPEIFTHQGWINLDAPPKILSQPSPVTSPPASVSVDRWRKAVAEDARFADEDFAQHWLCLLGHGEILELFVCRGHYYWACSLMTS